MRLTRASTVIAGAIAVVLLSAGTANAQILKTVDRKFPTGKYCPLESRAAAGVDLSFVAPAATVRIAFSGNNLDSSNQWNAFRLDNVTLVAKSVFDLNLVGPVPGFDDCYNTSPPPGQTTGGIPNVPAYNFSAANTPEAYLDLFPSGVTGWSGSHQYFEPNSTAPTDPAAGTGTTGGSLGLGLETDGAVAVSAGRVVGGLTSGQTYVVFAWWYAASTSPLTISITVPCADQDGDGFVTCDGTCAPLSTETCGDCNDTNPHCSTNCTDRDGDGWCVTTDCDDSVATCNSDCATDADTDAIPDCRDGCIDADGDGYGNPGGAPNTCLGADCSPNNPWCNVSCVDTDGDFHCAPGDCNDSNPSVANELPEVNDWLDQNCPGDDGYGVADEISGKSGFVAPGDKTVFSWPYQAGGLNYLAVRSTSPAFPAGCASSTTSLNSWMDAANPAPGGAFYYLVRSLLNSKGSWGQKSGFVERAAICGAESDCGNAADDDGDGLPDCADPDCSGTPACRVQTFAFADTIGNNIADNALAQFFTTATAGASDYIFFELVESPTRTTAWCSTNAGYYRSQYLSLAATFGTVTSGSWNKWRKAPATGNAWQGPDTTGHLNTFGDDCFGLYSWCSEQFSPEPKNCIFPNRTNDCEAYDLATGACGASIGGTWQLTIRIAASRFAACGF
jgi:hypothetical protein